MASALRFRFILALIFITAFCSYAYELVLAQILSILWGDVVLQYTITTGVYIASMGVGAFLTPTKASAERSFIWLEVTLSLFATTAPLCMVGADVHYPTFAAVISYTCIVAIGFLSGMELPLLMRILQETTTESDKSERALFTDYVGMFFAGFLFALYFNRTWGTLQTSLWLALLNLGLALLCGFIWGLRYKKLRFVETPVVLMIFILMAWLVIHYLPTYQEQLEKWVIGK